MDTIWAFHLNYSKPTHTQHIKKNVFKVLLPHSCRISGKINLFVLILGFCELWAKIPLDRCPSLPLSFDWILTLWPKVAQKYARKVNRVKHLAIQQKISFVNKELGLVDECPCFLIWKQYLELCQILWEALIGTGSK